MHAWLDFKAKLQKYTSFALHTADELKRSEKT